MNNTLKAALELHEMGASVIPVVYKSKEPATRWKDVDFTREDLERFFSGDEMNIGVKLGSVSGDLADIDLDHQMAVSLAKDFLPLTPAVFGRESKPRSHYIYRSKGLQYEKFTTKSHGTLLEIRANAKNDGSIQTVFPPSVHPSGEAIRWDSEGEFTEAEATLLEKQARRLAAATLLVLEWPAIGTRADTRLALAGWLLRWGWAEDDVTHFIEVVSSHGGAPQERVADLVGNTKRKLDLGQEVTGWPTLSGYIGEEAAKALRKFLQFDDETVDRESGKRSQVDLLLDIVGEAELFRDKKDSYIRFKVSGHLENRLVRSSNTRDWLLVEFHRRHKSTPSADAVKRALDYADAAARIDGQQHSVCLRVAEHEDRVYLDLGNEEWTCVEIDAHGWRLTSNPPVRFRRGNGHAIPAPVSGGSIDLLRKYVNVRDDDEFVLLLGFVLASYQPGRPYPILFVEGVPGSAKTTLLKTIRLLIDPCAGDGRGLPRNTDDLFVAAKNNYLISGDNSSGVSADIADSLCTLATGGGLTKRKHYTDDEEYCLEAMRPVAVTGINIPTDRQDVLDRAIAIRLERILDSNRKTEADLFKEFEADRGPILGAICDAISCSLRNRKTIEIKNLPRMADAALWIEAGGDAFGWRQGRFCEAHRQMRERLMEDSARADVLSRHIASWLDYRPEGYCFSGTATELQDELELYLMRSEQSGVLQNPAWPGSPTKLGKHLKRIVSGLETLGVVYSDSERDRDKRTLYRLSMSPDKRSEPQLPLEETECPF